MEQLEKGTSTAVAVTLRARAKARPREKNCMLAVPYGGGGCAWYVSVRVKCVVFFCPRFKLVPLSLLANQEPRYRRTQPSAQSHLKMNVMAHRWSDACV